MVQMVPKDRLVVVVVVVLIRCIKYSMVYQAVVEVRGLAMEEVVGGATCHTASVTNGANRLAKNATEYGGNYYTDYADWPGSWQFLNYDCVRGGGLIILRCETLNGQGAITSIGAINTTYDPKIGYYTGACGGGGSINIFATENVELDNLEISSLGGKVTQNNTNGGDGCSTIGVISGGTFLKK